MILVTGATGRLGGHVVRALRKLGQPVRALVRKGSAYYWLNDTGCAYHFGDLRDPASLDRACRGVRYVVAASGVEYETRGNDHTSVTVDGHAALWKAAAGRGVERVVYVSAMGVDRGYAVPWFDAKKKAEESLAASGVPFTVLRPAPFSRMFAELARRAATRGTVVVPGPGTNRVAPIAIPNLALVSVAAVEIEAWRGRAIEVAGPDAVTSRDAVDLALQKGGEGGVVRFAPDAVGRAAARVSRTLGKRWHHRLMHFNRWLTDDFVADTADLVAATGVPLTALADALDGDLAEILPFEDPTTREERVVHQKFDATVYEPGEAPASELPTGPLRYDT
jgi:uncharacterized protein YbjT (DUF2867 family)